MKSFPPDEKEGYVLFFPRAQIHLHAMASGCGAETRRNPAQYDLSSSFRGQHSYCIWQYTLDGEGELTVNGRTSRLKTGDAMLLLAPDNYRYRLPEDSGKWKHIFLSFCGSEMLRIWGEIIRGHGNVVKLSPDKSKCVDRAVEILAAAKSKKIRSAFQASRMIYSFVMALCEDLEIQSFSASESSFVLDAIRFCMDHYAENISVDDIAAAAGYSRCHFSRMFAVHHGISPGRFLRELRLGNAARMLQLESCNVKEVAERCGFADESHFCKLFREHYGMTPDLFRKKR